MSCSRITAECLLFAALTNLVADAVVLTHLVPDAHRDAASLEPFGNDPIPGTAAAPEGREIAVLLRGETFRHGYKDARNEIHRAACSNEGKAAQMNCTRSVIEKIIEPLEGKGNSVTVFFASTAGQRTRLPQMTEHMSDFRGEEHDSTPSCALDNLVFNAYKAKLGRAVLWRTFASVGQADALMQILDSFDSQFDGAGGVAKKFSSIIIVRNDLYIFKSIVHVIFDQINVLARCQLGAPSCVGGSSCIHDTFWMMPGHLYGAFRSALDTSGCFERFADPFSFGHVCEVAMRAAVADAGYPGKFGWLEDGRRKVRKVRQVRPVTAGDVTAGDFMNNADSYFADLIPQPIKP